jgi:hypothetical protein
MLRPVADVRLDWLPPEKGGRAQPFVGALYAPTAHFQGDSELFSVVLRFADSSQPNPTQAKLGLLASDLLPDVQGRIVPGCNLEITEGPRPVAHCRVLSVAMEQAEAP